LSLKTACGNVPTSARHGGAPPPHDGRGVRRHDSKGISTTRDGSSRNAARGARLPHRERRIVVEDEPTDEQIRGAGLDPREDTLFGLYEGVPLEARGHDYAALPDKISIFYLPIVETCTSTAEIRDEIRTTVLHEVAHFFGIDDEDLDEWGY
jgi:predicted Zn-dependent protease with MMP-like domain